MAKYIKALANKQTEQAWRPSKRRSEELKRRAARDADRAEMKHSAIHARKHATPSDNKTIVIANSFVSALFIKPPTKRVRKKTAARLLAQLTGKAE